jgi:NADPH2:quinone reductase
MTPGRVRARFGSGCWPRFSYTDAMLRAGSYLGVPNPPFTPGYELVGVVEELGPGYARLRVGDRVGALTVWGADAERVCVPEAGAVEVPEDLDPGEVLSLVFIYMTAYQLLHRMAKVKPGEAVLVHGAAGRVGTAVLELGGVAGLRLYGTCSARDRAAVERLGAVAIDYRSEDFVARVRALRPGGRLVVYGHSATVMHGRRSWRGWAVWYATTPLVGLWGLLDPRRRVSAYRIQRLRANRHQALPIAGRSRPLPVGGEPRNPQWFREDFGALLELLRRGDIHPVVAQRLPLTEARHAHQMLHSSASKGKLVLVP